MDLKPQPPKWATRFLEWYCRPDLLEEVHGDLQEIFERGACTHAKRAAIGYAWNVLRFCRLKNIRKRKSAMNHHSPSLTLGMFRSYVLSTMRNIRGNQFQSSVNIIGLALALGCGITIFLLLDSYYHRDQFHDKGDRLYLLMNDIKSGDIVEHWARSPYMLGPALRDAHPAIESVVRVQRDQLTMKNGSLVFHEPVWFVDPEFFEAFSYEILVGDKNSLRDPTTIAITKEVAIKYFGSEEVVNQNIQVKYGDNDLKTYRVGAVVATIPDQSSMHFGVMIPMEEWEHHVEPTKTIQWRTWAASTFVVFKEGHKPAELSGSVERFRQTQRAANDKFQIESVTFIPMREVAERSYDMNYALSWSNVPAAMIGLGIIAVCLVLLACFNYMNVAIASVATRLKEIGIRKVVGGGRTQIILQFMIENVVLCTLAMGIGTALAAFVLLPGFNSLYPIHVPFKFSSDLTMVVFFVGTVLFVALVSGAYPAFYVSSHNAVTIMRGREKFGTKSLFSKLMLTVQFVISFTTIVSGFVFINSSRYFELKDWGYQHSGRMYVHVSNLAQYRELQQQLSNHKDVINFAGAESHIGKSSHNTTVSIGNDQLAVSRFEVGFNYLETMNVRILQGRAFDARMASDSIESVVVNDAFVQKLNWKDPVGKWFEFDGQKWFVIGVADNFNFKEFYYDIEPVMMHIGKDEHFRYVVAHVKPESLHAISDQLHTTWSRLVPNEPFEASVQDDVFQQFFDSNRSNNKIMITISGVALALALMGLYGLMSYNLTRRLKEFSIRKVFGASLLHIIREMNRDYVWILLAAFVISAPLGMQLTNQMITAAYPEHIPIPLWPFVFTAALILFTVLVTVFAQISRLSKSTPAETLRID